MITINFDQPISVYFLGIGGISMSGLAEVLNNKGFAVSGSDWHESDITRSLEAKGIKVFYGEDASHITPDIQVAVLTSAVHENNKEFQAIKALGIPYMSRAELLGQLMTNYDVPIAISGTHGKTTTTSMVSEILLEADTDPTLSIGGIYGRISGNIRVGGSEYFVTEACEYTNSFLSFNPKIGIILNIRADHLDFFKDLDDIRHSFRKFAELLPEDGTLIINSGIENLSEITDGLKCKVITFGLDEGDYTAGDVIYNEKGCPSFKLGKPCSEDIFSLNVPGIHNVCNALAAIALADLLGISRTVTQAALDSYHGTDRRFQLKGNLKGINVVDDYAHHPDEIEATLTAAANYPHERLWVVFQSHTFSRTKALMDDFARALTLADRIVLADIYPARETDNLGISARTLQKKIQELGHSCEYFPSFQEIEKYLLTNCTKGDLLITMGAGDVYKIGENLLGE